MRGSSYPARNDETISTPPNKFLGLGLQLHVGPAGGTRRCDADPSDAASLQPRNFRVESSTKKQTMLQTNLSQNQGSVGPEWQSQAAAPRVRRLCSIEPCCHAADDYRPKTAVRDTTRSGDVSDSGQFQNAKLLRQEAAISLSECFLVALIYVCVPD